MALLTARLDDDLAAKFTALAAQHGGKSALLRRLLQSVVSRGAAPAEASDHADGTVRLTASVPAAEAAQAREVARQQGLTTGRWLRRLMSQALSGDPSAPAPAPPVDVGGARISASFSRNDAKRLKEAARREGMTPSQWLRVVALEKLAGEGLSSGMRADDDGGANLVRVATRMRSREAAAVRRAASARGMLVGQWLRALIRVRLGKGTQYSAAEQLALRKLAAEVSRVGVNLNQLARGVNEARKMGKPLPAAPAAVEMAKATVERALGALEKMARGNVRYWENGE